MTTLIVVAKEPLSGRAKTRLHPPLTLEQAARVAAAALDDTLELATQLPASRRVLFYDGDIVPDSARGFDVIAQPEGRFDQRLAFVFDACSGPTVLIGMDTPQAKFADLLPAFGGFNDTDVWFGPATDGGYWALGMREPRGDVIRGVPMSQDDTGVQQLSRLCRAGLTVSLLPQLSDVDTFETALEVAALAPQSRFGKTMADLLSAGAPDQKSWALR